MYLVRYIDLFPKRAALETLAFDLSRHASLPRGRYAIVEAYCPDPNCDCRRVMLNIFRVQNKPGNSLVSISYGFDRLDDDADPFIDPLNPRSKWSAELLEIVADMLVRNPKYVRRFIRHYKEVKRLVGSLASNSSQRPTIKSRKNRRPL